MNDPEAFHDTNIVLYLLSSDPVKADCAEALLDTCVVSVEQHRSSNS